MPLNADFTRGGTGFSYFRDNRGNELVLHLRPGSISVHPGNVNHYSVPVQDGDRYVLAGFANGACPAPQAVLQLSHVADRLNDLGCCVQHRGVPEADIALAHAELGHFPTQSAIQGAIRALIDAHAAGAATWQHSKGAPPVMSNPQRPCSSDRCSTAPAAEEICASALAAVQNAQPNAASHTASAQPASKKPDAASKQEQPTAHNPTGVLFDVCSGDKDCRQYQQPRPNHFEIVVATSAS